MNDFKNQNHIPRKRKFSGEIYLFLFLLILLLAGLSTLSVAFYQQYGGLGNGSIDSNNTITTGDIVFAYSDAISDGKPSNGIQITNAMPLSDELGKIMIKDRTYFDFQIIAKEANNNVKYEVILEKLQSSTLSDDNVKVYVTELQGSEEIPITETLNYGAVKVYSQFEDASLQNVDGKKLFEREVNNNNYQRNYRLRIWLRENAQNYSNQTFSVKVLINAFTSAK